MKKHIIIFAILFLMLTLKTAFAQIQADPAHWAYGLKKLSANTYEVHLRCTLDNNWHIYAQKQTKDFIGTATKITFNKQPGLTLIGKPRENGKKDIYKDETAGIVNNELLGIIDFVQKVVLRPGIKTIRGKIIYQTCTHEHCLTPTDVDFSVPVR